MLKKYINANRMNQFYALLHQFLMAAYGFALIFIMAHLMPQEEVGRWILFVSALSIGDMLMHGLLQTVVIKEMANIETDKENTHQVSNNALLLSLSLVFILSTIIFIIKLISLFLHHTYELVNDFANWYPLLGVFMSLYNLSWWINSGKMNFKTVFFQRVIYCSISLIILLISYLIQHELSFKIAVLSQLIGYAICSFFTLIVNRYKFHTRYISMDILKKYWAYGKFNIGTMLGSSLLRNADTFMIAAIMNSSSVALYSIAQKIIEVFEVLLRTVASTSLPLLYNSKNNISDFSQKLFIRIIGLTILFIPIAILTYLFSEQIISLISGSEKYLLSSIILKTFMIYVLFLPTDRLIGVALEACNKPHLNFIKTLLLIIVNISGNFIALHYFKSLIGVAAVSSLALMTGILIGLYFLNKTNSAKLSQFKWRQSLLDIRIQLKA